MELSNLKAFEKTKEDVTKLKGQITNLISSLQNDGSIFKVEQPNNLGPILSKKFKISSGIKTGTGKSSRTQSSKKSGKSQFVEDEESLEEGPDAPGTQNQIFVPNELESSLIYFMDKWIYSLEILNESNCSQNVPKVLLSFAPNPNKCTRSLNQFLAFEYSISPLPNGGSHPSQIIRDPTGLESLPKGSNNQDHEDSSARELQGVVKILPGQRFLISVSFSHPAFGSENEFELDFSLVKSTNSNYYSVFFTRSIKISPELCLTCSNEDLIQKHKWKLFSALAQYKETFSLKTLEYTDEDLYKLLEKFLIRKLSFEIILKEKMSKETVLITFGGTKEASPFWGILFHTESDLKNTNILSCSISTRNKHQLGIFFAQFSRWYNEQRAPTSLRIEPLFFRDLRTLHSKLSSELETLIHLIHLTGSGLIGFRNPPPSNDNQSNGTAPNYENYTDLNWLKHYINDLIRTDLHFLPFFHRIF